MRLLLVEDDQKLSDLLARGLREEGFAVDVAENGLEGDWKAIENDYDAIVLDVMLPEMDGFEILEHLRSKAKKTPVLMLTARGSIQDRVRGLNSGADDYLKKPFAFEELVARLHALLRRASQINEVKLRIADLELDPLSHEAARAGKSLSLTAKEFAILEYLIRHRGHIISRTTLSEHVWDENFDSMSNVVEVTGYRLREKLNAFGPPLIHTVRNVGYVLRELN